MILSKDKLFQNYKCIVFEKSESLLAIRIFKTPERIIRLFAFSLIIWIFGLLCNYFVGYCICAGLVVSFALYIMTNEQITINLASSKIEKCTFFFNRKVLFNFSFSLYDPLIIRCFKYNNNIDGDAFNFNKFDIYINYINKFILFNTDDDIVIEHFILFFKNNKVYFNNYPIEFLYEGLRPNPLDELV